MNTEITATGTIPPRQLARMPTEPPNGNGFVAAGDGGRPNRLRGMGKDSAYFDIALALVQEFPIGSELSQDTFDGFVARMRESKQFQDRAEDIGLYVVPVGAAKTSGEHALYLKRRNELRYNLSNAATTPRMIEAVTEIVGEPGSGFRLDVPRAGWIIVRASLDAFIDSGVSSAIERWILGEQKKLRHLQREGIARRVRRRNWLFRARHR
jgi:hypothetical protein